MGSTATPRILPSHLSHFPQKVVLLLGTITSLHGDNATLTSCNNESVTLILNRDSHLSLQSMYEIIGKVINLEGGQGLGIRVLGATLWPKNESTGQNADLKAFEAVVDATHRYKSIFYADEDGAGVEDGMGAY